MNREDAYNRIDAIIAKHEIDDEYVTITSILDYDALRMARKALEQQSCGDAISRASAINAVSEALKRTFVEYEDLARKIINKLPPVTPQKCDKCEVGNPCLYCKHEFEPQEESEVRNETIHT